MYFRPTWPGAVDGVTTCNTRSAPRSRVPDTGWSDASSSTNWITWKWVRHVAYVLSLLHTYWAPGGGQLPFHICSCVLFSIAWVFCHAWDGLFHGLTSSLGPQASSVPTCSVQVRPHLVSYLVSIFLCFVFVYRQIINRLNPCLEAVILKLRTKQTLSLVVLLAFHHSLILSSFNIIASSRWN